MSDTIKPGLLPPLTPSQKKACQAIELVMDHEGRTAIVLKEEKTEVAFIPLLVEGLCVTYTSPSVFRQKFPLSQRDPKSPRSLQATSAAAAARCYVTHATFCGADKSALDELERLVPITVKEKEKIMSVKKADPKPEKTAKKSAAKATKPEKGAAKASKPAKPTDEKKAKPSVTFRELIMQGKLTDDQIFAEVQKRHPEVGDDKRSYVAWYRNDLKKKGENPPAPKKGLKDAA